MKRKTRTVWSGFSLLLLLSPRSVRKTAEEAAEQRTQREAERRDIARPHTVPP
jgi:hypothetical protein